MRGDLRKSSTKQLYALCLLILFIVLSGSFAWADESEPTVAVRVSITEVYTLNECPDGCGIIGVEADFFTIVIIGDETFQSGNISNNNNPHPTDWVFTSKQMPLSQGSVPMNIQIWDEDPSPNPNDHYDINGVSPDRDFELTVNFAPCSIQTVTPIRLSGTSGDTLVGSCNTLYYSGGREGSRPDTASIRFKIEVIEPTHGPDLRVRCLHSPLWPAWGDTVTITAEALDGTVDSTHTPRQRIADSIEIWIDGKTAPVKVGSGVTTSVAYGPLNRNTFVYNCRVTDDGIQISTGWRMASVGSYWSQLYVNTVPVFYSGYRTGVLDIIFYADRASYPLQENFRDDVYKIIWNSFFVEDVFLRNQQRFNFWIAPDYADVQIKVESPKNLCDPTDGFTQRAWVDLPIVLHTRNCRDEQLTTSWAGLNATTNMASTEQSPYRVVLHEASHGLFSLADEYPDGGCTNGWPVPNVYDFQTTCEQDATDSYVWDNDYCEQNALKIGRSASDCRSFPCHGKTLWTSDPMSNDLMSNVNGRPQQLDIRRMEWKFCKCRYGGC